MENDLPYPFARIRISILVQISNVESPDAGIHIAHIEAIDPPIAIKVNFGNITGDRIGHTRVTPRLRMPPNAIPGQDIRHINTSTHVIGWRKMPILTIVITRSENGDPLLPCSIS